MNNKTKKAILNSLKIFILSICLLYGPSATRGMSHCFERSDKSFELDTDSSNSFELK